LAGALLLVLFARFWHFLATSPSAKCSGALCAKNGGGAEWILYLLASIMLVSSILRFKWFSFILTDQSVTIDSGILVQKSRVIRFDRIQDVEARRSALHMLLGLKSVAIWTASLDQIRGNSRRPDGLIVLEAASADWLADFLIHYDRKRDESARGGTDDGITVTSRSRPGSFGALIGLASAAVFAVLAWGFRSGSGGPPTTGFAKATAVTVPAASRAAPGASTALADAPQPHTTTRPAAPTYAANPDAAPDDYSIACAADSTGSSRGVAACDGLKWGERCGREAQFRSNPTPEGTRLVVANRSNQSLKFYWLDAQGRRNQYAVLAPGRKIGQQSHIGAYWLVTTDDERCVGIFNADTARIGIF
jgi:membrane protein YdbS with pleckstrin-like domain